MRVPWTQKVKRSGLLTLSKWSCFLLTFYHKMWALRTESRFSKRYLHTHVHNSIIHKQEMGATQMSTMAEWINKIGLMMEYRSVLIKGNPAIFYYMNGSWRHFAKWKKPGTKWQIVYEYTYMRCLKLLTS